MNQLGYAATLPHSSVFRPLQVSVYLVIVIYQELLQVLLCRNIEPSLILSIEILLEIFYYQRIFWSWVYFVTLLLFYFYHEFLFELTLLAKCMGNNLSPSLPNWETVYSQDPFIVGVSKLWSLGHRFLFYWHTATVCLWLLLCLSRKLQWRSYGL